MTTKVRLIFGWVNSRSGSSTRSIFALLLFDFNLGSTPSLALVPSISHLRLCGGQLQIWIQFCFHNCVVPFEDPLHLWLQSHLCLTWDLVEWSFWVPTMLCYLQNWTFHPLFLFISILFVLCLHKPYFLLFKGNFDSL